MDLDKKEISGAFRWLVPMSEYNMMGMLPLPELGGRHSNFGVCAHQVGMWEQHGRQKKVVLHFMAQSV